MSADLIFLDLLKLDADRHSESILADADRMPATAKLPPNMDIDDPFFDQRRLALAPPGRSVQLGNRLLMASGGVGPTVIPLDYICAEPRVEHERRALVAPAVDTGERRFHDDAANVVPGHLGVGGEPPSAPLRQAFGGDDVPPLQDEVPRQCMSPGQVAGRPLAEHFRPSLAAGAIADEILAVAYRATRALAGFYWFEGASGFGNGTGTLISNAAPGDEVTESSPLTWATSDLTNFMPRPPARRGSGFSGRPGP